MRVSLLATLLAPPALAQTRPPVLLDIEPYGLQRGTTVTFTVNGANLMGADRVLFDAAGLSGTIGAMSDQGADIRKKVPGETGAVIQDKAEKNRVQITVTAAATVPTGRHGFRLHTPLGTTSFISFWVGAEAEAVERTPNDAADKAMALTPPVTVNGSLPKEGDVDYYRVDARAGRDLVVRVLATPLGSMMDPKVALLSPDGRELASNDDFNGMRDSLVVFRPEADGPVIVRIADANAGGGWRHIYRATIGELPVITGVFPLGRPKGSAASVNVEGANLDGHTAGALGTPLPDQPLAAPVHVTGLDADPINRVQVSLGSYPEVLAGDSHRTLATALLCRGAGDGEWTPHARRWASRRRLVPLHRDEGPDPDHSSQRGAPWLVARFGDRRPRCTWPSRAARAAASGVGDDGRPAQSRIAREAASGSSRGTSCIAATTSTSTASC